VQKLRGRGVFSEISDENHGLRERKITDCCRPHNTRTHAPQAEIFGQAGRANFGGLAEENANRHRQIRI
jgi:hypothetical protein